MQVVNIQSKLTDRQHINTKTVIKRKMMSVRNMKKSLTSEKISLESLVERISYNTHMVTSHTW